VDLVGRNHAYLPDGAEIDGIHNEQHIRRACRMGRCSSPEQAASITLADTLPDKRSHQWTGGVIAFQCVPTPRITTFLVSPGRDCNSCWSSGMMSQPDIRIRTCTSGEGCA
jgi:hypothetical protein